jgi:hypothetical protein
MKTVMRLVVLYATTDTGYELTEPSLPCVSWRESRLVGLSLNWWLVEVLRAD